MRRRPQVRHGVIGSTLASAAAFAVGCVIVAQAASLAAQGNQGGGAAQATPRPAPARDLTGVWMKRTPPGVESFNGATWTPGVPPPLTAWGLERYKGNRSNNTGEYTLDETNDPVLIKCYPPGVPRVYFHPYPFEFVQTPGAVLQIFEYDHFLRRMWTDGRALPEDPDLLWMGTSVGRWADDSTFVVETVGFDERTWIDRAGTPHSDQLKVTERFRRVAFDRLELDFIMEDALALARPWTATGYFELQQGWELGEISCSGDYLEWPGA